MSCKDFETKSKGKNRNWTRKLPFVLICS